MSIQRYSAGVMPGAAFLDDWDVACRARANVLIIGPTDTTTAVVRESRVALFEPVIGSLCTDALVLPSADLAGTLVLRDVGRLALVDQLRLAMWLETTHAQVISTSPEPLLPLVQAGLFLEMLYYRLNTICLDASAVPNSAERSRPANGNRCTCIPIIRSASSRRPQR